MSKKSCQSASPNLHPPSPPSPNYNCHPQHANQQDMRRLRRRGRYINQPQILAGRVERQREGAGGREIGFDLNLGGIERPGAGSTNTLAIGIDGNTVVGSYSAGSYGYGFEYTIAAVPEPSSFILLGLAAAAGICCLQLTRRKKAPAF